MEKMYLDEVPHETSVKKLRVLEKVTQYSPGVADFDFMPVFSAFDYGTMKPEPGLDNSTICLMGGFNFELLREEGVESHYIGLVDKDNNQVSAREAAKNIIAPNKMRIKLVNRINPEAKEDGWDYSKFQNSDVVNYIQPVEFMSRNSLPKSSSVWRRVDAGKLTFEDLGLSSDFERGDEIPNPPILDYSTKFEPKDRYISPEEAQKIMGINDERFARINETTKKASNIMTKYAESRGFERLDGKVEYAVLGGQDVLGDVVCTWHEDRLIGPGGTGISKQRIRDKLAELNPEWYAEINRAKKEAEETGKDFHDLMDPSITYEMPSEEFFHKVNDLFRAATNQWVNAEVYNVYPGKTDSLEDTLLRAEEEFGEVAVKK